MSRRAVGGAFVVGLTLVLVACGAGSTEVGPSATTSSAPAGATKAVTFGAVTVDVPAGWPVYDLTAVPHHCARFDVHAVYLGHQQSDAVCPARALGKTDAVQIEADDDYAKARLLPSAPGATVNGETPAYEPGVGATHEIVATFARLGVVVKATYGSDQTTAQQIVASVRSSGA